MTRLAVVVFSLVLVWVLWSPAALAQAPRDGRLIITVVDQTTAVIPGAVVTVVGLDDAGKKKTIEPAKTSEKGVATFDHVAPGRYAVKGEFPGFDIGLLRDVRVKAGDNKHLLVLPLQKLTEEITVGRDAQTTASDRAGTFGTALTREQVDALSDDPEEMQRQLQDLAGPGAAIRVDSFEGQQLPPKAQIKAIHVTRDMFAAENHMAGGMFIDIITQPGIGPLRANARVGFYDSSMDGRNALTQQTGSAQSRNFSGYLGGSLIKNKSSFSLYFYGADSYRTPDLNVATLSGTHAQNLNLRMPENSLSFSGLFDYAITKDQTLRLSVSRNGASSGNQGVGGYDLIERAYSTDRNNVYMRIQEAGPLGRRFFTNTRFSLNWSDSSSRSTLEAPTIIVNDAFTSGGAQRAGGRYTRTFTLQSDLDYVRGIHSLRGGVQFDGGSYRTDDSANYLGTYTFDSLAAYQAGLPWIYTRRLGDPNIEYWNLQAGVYVQDDIRVKKGLTLSPGLRVEVQTHLQNYNNVSPRFGVTWAPFKNGKTTLRGSWGIFHDWLNFGTYEQTLRVDGFHQQELILANPSYPDPGTAGVIPPTNRYLLGNDLQMARYMRLSAGVDQQITKALRIGAVYSNSRANGLLIGQNLNAPVNGLRPNPAFVNIIETSSAAESRSQSVMVNVNLNFAPGPTGPATTGPRFAWKRGLMLMGYYNLAKSENNTDGPFTVPASGNLATEWGPSSGDVRHRASMYLYTGALKNLTAYISAWGTSASPFTIRTGDDDNHDLMFNDRPAGVGRNTARAAAQWGTYANVTYSIGIGKRTVPMGPGISITSSGGALSVGTYTQPDAPRYRIMLSTYLENLTNHANYTGYIGNMKSPFFLQPTSVDGVRRVTFSLGFSF